MKRDFEMTAQVSNIEFPDGTAKSVMDGEKARARIVFDRRQLRAVIRLVEVVGGR